MCHVGYSQNFWRSKLLKKLSMEECCHLANDVAELHCMTSESTLRHV